MVDLSEALAASQLLTHRPVMIDTSTLGPIRVEPPTDRAVREQKARAVLAAEAMRPLSDFSDDEYVSVRTALDAMLDFHA